jgi:hypothetical protein
MSTRRKPRRYLIMAARRLLAAVFLSQVLNRGARAVARGAVPSASQVLDRGAEAIAPGAARCASQILDRGA